MTDVITPESSTVVSSDKKASARDRGIDIVKGIAIICMVAAHCGMPFPYTDLVYLFHMAVFFMASGYFYNEKNSESLLAVAKYSLKKVKALYIPYVLVNCAFSLLHNFFIKINFYTTDPIFLELGGDGAAWGLQWPYPAEFSLAVLKTILRFGHEPQLVGAAWFLRTLFIVSIAHCVIMWAVKKLKPRFLRTAAFVIVIVVCCVTANSVQQGAVIISEMQKNVFSCYLAYVLGIFVRKNEKHFRYDATSAIISFALLFLLRSNGSISLNVGWITSLSFFFICSMLGWILLRSIAGLVSGAAANVLAYAGNNSIFIVFLHFISFKIVTLIVLLIRGDSMVLLASFPVLHNSRTWLWVAYTIVGTAVPLLVCFVYKKIKIKMFTFLKSKFLSKRAEQISE